MSDRQRLRKKEIEELIGPYDKDAVRKATGVLLKRFIEKTPKGEKLILFSDEHYQYRECLDFDLKDHCFIHETVSSKVTRNFQNILFPVNHTDLLIRERVPFPKSGSFSCTIKSPAMSDFPLACIAA